MKLTDVVSITKSKKLKENGGRIVKGVNTTADVSTDEIKKQAAKFGNKVDKDGRPPTLSKKVKGSKTNVLYNLGLSERFTPMEIAIIEGGHSLEDYRQSQANAMLTEAQEIASTTEIYVDMDGVLVDFFGAWAKLMQKDHFTKIDDVKGALQKIRDTDDFWLNLPKTSNADQLLNIIKQIKGNYTILSSPLADDPKSEPHKREWIKNNLTNFPPKDVIITHDKAKYATQKDGTPNILIDDYGVNIKNWQAAGGVGFKHKDHKFERTAKAIKQHMQEPVEEGVVKATKEDLVAYKKIIGLAKKAYETNELEPYFYDAVKITFNMNLYKKYPKLLSTLLKVGRKMAKDDWPYIVKDIKKNTGIDIESHIKENLDEGYKLHLERDDDLMVLHIVDTKSGKRTEVRGKPGYERGNYDANDKLHKLLDTVGKSANIAELINGEVVTINPKHPDAERAKKATDVAYNENFADGKVKVKEVDLDEISAKDIGAGALAGLMALTPVSKAFGQDANTNPLPNKQTSTMVQKDVAGKKDLSKISVDQVKSQIEIKLADGKTVPVSMDDIQDAGGLDNFIKDSKAKIAKIYAGNGQDVPDWSMYFKGKKVKDVKYDQKDIGNKKGTIFKAHKQNLENKAKWEKAGKPLNKKILNSYIKAATKMKGKYSSLRSTLRSWGQTLNAGDNSPYRGEIPDYKNYEYVNQALDAIGYGK